MYVPKQYAVNDPKEVHAFLKAHPFLFYPKPILSYPNLF